MEKIKEFFKNKTVGYYIAIADAVLALVLAIIYFATYKTAMANNAAANIPETIGIFLLAGFVVECVLLVLPQYRFIHVIALVMYGLALYKEILLIPALIADWANNVFYQGGNLGTNVFYLVTLLLIAISAIVAVFFGFYKKEEEADEDMAVKKGQTLKVVKIAAGTALVVAAVLSSSLVAINMKNAANAAAPVDPEPVEPPVHVEPFDPITDDVRAKADAYAYDFKPEEKIIKEQESYTYGTAELNALGTGDTRADHNLVYVFEGSYAEGYQGDYSETYGYLYLWDDGLFGGKIRDTNVKGYWFNSSLTDGKDEQGNDIKDCLKMVSNVSKYESIITEPATGFYECHAYVYLNMGWGTRSMILNGYVYYPVVDLAIDTADTGTEFKVGKTFDRSSWTANRILKNLNYSAVFKASEVRWTDPAGMLDGGKFAAAGSYDITATWNGLTATKTITVTE